LYPLLLSFLEHAKLKVFWFILKISSYVKLSLGSRLRGNDAHGGGKMMLTDKISYPKLRFIKEWQSTISPGAA
jgi:hypothetical protein